MGMLQIRYLFRMMVFLHKHDLNRKPKTNLNLQVVCEFSDFKSCLNYHLKANIKQTKEKQIADRGFLFVHSDKRKINFDWVEKYT